MHPLCLVISLLAIDGGTSPTSPTAVTMRGNLQALVGLQPALSSSESFADPKNRAAIEGSLKVLSGLQHQFLPRSDREPGAASVAVLFGQQMERAATEFSSGQTEAARARLRGVTTLCLACHTRGAIEKDFEDASKAVEAMPLSPLRKATFYATTRQFDRALALWAEGLQEAPKTELEGFEQSDAVRMNLAVLVRVKDDPAATVAFLTARAGRKDQPPFVTRPIAAWLKEAKAWQAEKFVASKRTPAQLFARAKALIDASGAPSTPLADPTHFVTLLRATGYLHSALEQQPGAPFRGEALYLLGVAAAATQDPLLWQLDDLYLEACIRENPHTPLAMRCVDRMTDRTWFGWTGSAGTNIPPDVSQRLGQLKALAK